MRVFRAILAAAAIGAAAAPAPLRAQNVTNPPASAANPTAPPGQTVAPHAGASGDAAAGTTAAPPAANLAPGSDNGGQLAGQAVPGGTNHAPAATPKAGSFSAPIQKN